jgi:hypothetical protein
MGWGDVAKAAMDKAIEAYKESVIVGERLSNLLENVRAMENRTTSKLEEYERRLREMESRISRVEGEVHGGFREAMTVVMKQHMSDPQKPDAAGFVAQVLPKDGKSLPDGTRDA